MNEKTQQKRNSIASISSIISSSDSGESEFDDEFYRNYQQKPIPMHLFKDRIKVISNCDNNIRENDFNMGPVADIGIIKPNMYAKFNNRTSNLRTTDENMDPNGDITFIIEEKNTHEKDTSKERNQKNKKRRNDSELVEEVKCCVFL